MARTIQVVIPTYHRLDKLQDTYEQLWGLDVIFVCHESDVDSQAMVKRFGLSPVIDTQPPSGVNATNAGYWATTAEWIVIGQDDFKWHPGWLAEAERLANETDVKVVGFNDGYIGRYEHSVGWLVNRPYIEEHSLSIGFPNVIFNPHYKKNFSDNELNDTAKFRGVWAYAEKALLEHLHPSFGKGKTDETYEVLDRAFDQDFELYSSRKHLWEMP